MAARNRRLALVLGGTVFGMVGLAYASVPLYQLFCQVTGYGGTTRVATVAPGPVSDLEIDVTFNADTARDLAWQFVPLQGRVTVRAGESALAFYRADNLGDTPIVGSATFNVTPQVAGAYFNKIDCFCFEEQYLEPGASAELPVQFFVDPAIADDPDTAGIRTITLSYTFYDAGPEALARRTEAANAATVSVTSVN
jgi:cytochrome c oxidase assembly protein subunit 11